MKKMLKITLSMFLLIAFIVTSLGFVAITIKSIKLNANNVSIEVGKTFSLKTTLVPSNTTQKLLTYTSSNINIASVSNTGVIKGKKAGKALITVVSTSNKSILAKCNVTVQKPSNLTPRGQYPIVKNQVTLKVMVNPLDWIGDLNTNKTTKWYENKTNVKINWQRVAQADYDQKMNLILASGDMPDVFLHRNTFAADKVSAYGSEGLFIPLNKLIDEWGEGIKLLFDYAPDYLTEIKSADGNIYALPRFSETYHMNYPNKAWINKKWLDNLNMKFPETTEEYYQVLKAFKTKDPNGNGKADEVPLTKLNDITDFFMNPFTFNPGQAENWLYYNAKSKKVEAAFNQTGWREGLKYLRKLYQEDLLDKEFLTIKQPQIKQLTENQDGCRLGSVSALAISAFSDLSRDTKKDYVALAPLKGPSGLKQTPYFPSKPRFTYVITKSSRNPIVAFRWADGFYDAFNETGWRGEENIDWRRAKPGEMGLDGQPASAVNLIPYGTNHNSFWEGFLPFGPGMETTKMRNQVVVVKEGVWEQEVVLINETKNKYEPNRAKDYKLLPLLYVDRSVRTDYIQITESIRTLVTDYTSRFITGTANIDSDWEKYLNELTKADVDKFIKYTQDAYNAKVANNK